MPSTSKNPGSARTRCAFFALVPLLVCAQASAQPAAQPADAQAGPRWGMYLQTARTPHDISAWTLGATLDWQDWRRSLWGSEVRGYWDFYASRWSARGVGAAVSSRQRKNSAPVSILPATWASASNWASSASMSCSCGWNMSRMPASRNPTPGRTLCNCATRCTFDASRHHLWTSLGKKCTHSSTYPHPMTISQSCPVFETAATGPGPQCCKSRKRLI